MRRFFRFLNVFAQMEQCVRNNPSLSLGQPPQVEPVDPAVQDQVDTVEEAQLALLDQISFELGEDYHFVHQRCSMSKNNFSRTVQQTRNSRFVVRLNGLIIGSVLWDTLNDTFLLFQLHVCDLFAHNYVLDYVLQELVRRTQLSPSDVIWVLVPSDCPDTESYYSRLGFQVQSVGPDKQMMSLQLGTDEVQTASVDPQISLDDIRFKDDNWTRVLFTPDGTSLSPEHYWQMVYDLDVYNFVVLYNNKIIGRVLWKLSHDSLRLLQFHLDDEYAQDHLYDAMMAELQMVARSNSLRWIRTWIPYDQLEREDFFKRLGFYMGVYDPKTSRRRVFKRVR